MKTFTDAFGQRRTLDTTPVPLPEGPRALVQEWVEALRSRKFSQAFGQLVDGNAYCCLGVLSEMVGKDSPGGCRWNGDSWWQKGHRRNDGTIPGTVWIALGLDKVFEVEEVLTTLNDTGRGFGIVTDYLEDKFLTVTREPEAPDEGR